MVFPWEKEGAVIRFPVVFVISAHNMEEEQVAELEKNFNLFLDRAKAEDFQRNIVETMVISYLNPHTKTIPWVLWGDWYDIKKIPYQYIDDLYDGGSNIRDAMTVARDVAKYRLSDHMGGDLLIRNSWIILMTSDPSTEPVDEIASELRDSVWSVTFAVGMGAYYNPSELEKFTDKTMAITDGDYEKFFDWLLSALLTECRTGRYVEDSMPNDERMIEMHKAFINNKGLPS